MPAIAGGLLLMTFSAPAQRPAVCGTIFESLGEALDFAARTIVEMWVFTPSCQIEAIFDPIFLRVVFAVRQGFRRNTLSDMKPYQTSQQATSISLCIDA